MEYRLNKKTQDHISVIGLGTAYISEAGFDTGVEILKKAHLGGINYFDLAGSDSKIFPLFKEAFQDIRDEVYYQIHFGANYLNGEYGWSLDLDTIKKSVSNQLELLGTDYIDYGFIHCQDELTDWQEYKKNGVLDYVLSLKEKGIIHHLGLSSHTPQVIHKILDEVDIDMLMFSINPAYDHGDGDYAFGNIQERISIYQRCEKEGIGISVMKPFSGGQLLDKNTSPFHESLTIYQCIKYALDQPGVLTVLPGAQSIKEIEHLLDYFNKTEEELDYSIIKSYTLDNHQTCVYCNHCKPCPVGIDIGLVNKYYDLANLGDSLAIEHYHTLKKNASDCIHCQHCNNRCPFNVNQSERMSLINDYFQHNQ